jgi:hypothetical protein
MQVLIKINDIKSSYKFPEFTDQNAKAKIYRGSSYECEEKDQHKDY